LLLGIKVDVERLKSLVVVGELCFKLLFVLEFQSLQPLEFLLSGEVLGFKILIGMLDVLIDQKCGVFISKIKLFIS
jgi:hypothetical protein